MPRNKIACEQKCPVEWSPDSLIMNPPERYLVEPYLLDPHMEGTIHSPLAALNTGTTHQYVVTALYKWVLLGIDLSGVLAFTVQVSVIKCTDTSPKRCPCRSSDDELFDVTNYCPFPTKILLRIVMCASESQSG